MKLSVTGPISPARKAAAVAIATVVVMISYSLMLFAFVSVSVDDGPSPGPPFALGLALVPFAFLALAFLSGNPRAPGATVVAMLLALAVALPVSALAQDAVTGLVAGFGAGGTVALRREVGHSLGARWVAVGLASFYIFLLLRTVTVVGLVAAPVLPFLSLAAADFLSERRWEKMRARTELVEAGEA